MKTTVAVDSVLLRTARAYANEQGITVEALIEEAVRARIGQRRVRAPTRPQASGEDSEVKRMLASMFASH